MTTIKRTPLFEEHKKLDAKLIDFGGWELPVNYGSQIEEHHSVRRGAGMFDVSHMTVTDVHGKDILKFLDYVLANSIRKTASVAGKAIYSCLLNHQGGVIDDLIAYRISDTHARIVSNAGTRAAVRDWLTTVLLEWKTAQTEQGMLSDVELKARDELALLAIQGPNTAQKLDHLVSTEIASKLKNLEKFQGQCYDELFAGRTGYTGEDGFEFIAPPQLIIELWRKALECGISPCGLGARDTLRLESGMALYGHELDTDYSPIECGLKWTVSLSDDRDFIGKTALMTPPRVKSVGLVLIDRGVLREQQVLSKNNKDIGIITSGSFSPSLEKSIALARVDIDSNIDLGDDISVKVRNKQLTAKVVRPPFIKAGESQL